VFLNSIEQGCALFGMVNSCKSIPFQYGSSNSCHFQTGFLTVKLVFETRCALSRLLQKGCDKDVSGMLQRYRFDAIEGGFV
jgi:hypothetical protein